MPNPNDHANDLRAYVGVLRVRKGEILVITAVVVAAALFFAFRQQPVYEGRSKVLVRPIQTMGSTTYSVPQAPDLDTERQLIMSQAIAGRVRTRLNPPIPVDTLLRNVGVQVVGTTEVLDIGYRSGTPRTAAVVANAFADAYVDYRTRLTLGQFQAAATALEKRVAALQAQIRQLEQQLSSATDQSERDSLATQRDTFVAQMGVMEQRLADLQSTASTVQSAAEVIQRAEPPSAPVSPNKVRDAVLGVLAGLFLGVAFAFLRERLDDRVKGREELEERIGAPMLAVVPRVAGWRRRDETRLIMRTEPKSPAAEAYRTLATNVQFMAARDDLRVIMVTSSLSGEGKSTTSANLAVAIAQSGRRVVLVSADLRKPRAARFFGVANREGLSNILAEGLEDPAPMMVNPGVPNLRVLGSGPTPKNPAELLASPRCAALVDRLRRVADLVIIDTPPVLAVADASILAGVTDGAIFLVDGEHTRQSAISQSRAQLETAGAQILGVVYNNYDPNQSHGYPYHYYGYQYSYGTANGTSGGGKADARPWLGARRARRTPEVVGFPTHGDAASN